MGAPAGPGSTLGLSSPTSSLLLGLEPSQHCLWTAWHHPVLWGNATLQGQGFLSSGPSALAHSISSHLLAAWLWSCGPETNFPRLSSYEAFLPQQLPELCVLPQGHAWVQMQQYTWKRMEVFQNRMRRNLSLRKRAGRGDRRNMGQRSRPAAGAVGF